MKHYESAYLLPNDVDRVRGEFVLTTASWKSPGISFGKEMEYLLVDNDLFLA